MRQEKLVFEKFVRTVDQYAMVSQGDKILVALSGGADSVALLCLFLDLQKSIDFHLCAAHLNHCLRGKESQEDERFVAELCQKLNIVCITAEEDIRKKARESRTSIEVAGREARLAFLHKTLKKIKASKIALGHTMNDQAENVLFRLLRGSGTKGLSSMRSLEGHIIRPLLSISRREIESYLSFKKTPFRIDSSNMDMRFTRNHIRHNLIPFLKEQYNPEIVETLARTATILSEEDAFFEALVSGVLAKEAKIKKGALEISIEIIKHLPPALSRRLIKRILQIVKGKSSQFTFKEIENIRDFLRKSRGNRDALLPPGINVKIYADIITFTSSSHKKPSIGKFQEALKIEGVTEIPKMGISIEASILNREDFTEDLKTGGKDKAFIDLDKTGKELLIRSLKKGDIFHPFHSPGRKKVYDFFIDKKIPREERNKAFIVASKRHIVWVVGHQIDDRCKVDNDTIKFLVLKLIKKKAASKKIDIKEQ